MVDGPGPAFGMFRPWSGQARPRPPDPPAHSDISPCRSVAIYGEKATACQADLTDRSNKLLRDIRDALAAGQLGTARNAAHGLLGMAGSFCATRVAAIARKIETKVTTIEAAGRESENLKLAIRQSQQWLEKTGRVPSDGAGMQRVDRRALHVGCSK